MTKYLRIVNTEIHRCVQEPWEIDFIHRNIVGILHCYPKINIYNNDRHNNVI